VDSEDKIPLPQAARAGDDVAVAQLPPMQVGEVVGIEAGSASDAVRLKRLGSCVGRRVQLVQAGDPLILRVHGARLGLSARLAERIRVTPCRRCEEDQEAAR